MISWGEWTGPFGWMDGWLDDCSEWVIHPFIQSSIVWASLFLATYQHPHQLPLYLYPITRPLSTISLLPWYLPTRIYWESYLLLHFLSPTHPLLLITAEGGLFPMPTALLLDSSLSLARLVHNYSSNSNNSESFNGIEENYTTRKELVQRGIESDSRTFYNNIAWSRSFPMLISILLFPFLLLIIMIISSYNFYSIYTGVLHFLQALENNFSSEYSGLLTFSSQAQVVVPFTRDYGALKSALYPSYKY